METEGWRLAASGYNGAIGVPHEVDPSGASVKNPGSDCRTQDRNVEGE
jgi:hypothetical protein